MLGVLTPLQCMRLCRRESGRTVDAMAGRPPVRLFTTLQPVYTHVNDIFLSVTMTGSASASNTLLLLFLNSMQAQAAQTDRQDRRKNYWHNLTPTATFVIHRIPYS